MTGRRWLIWLADEGGGVEGIPGFVARMVEQLLARRKDLDSVRKVLQ